MNFAASPVLALTLPTWRSRFLLYVFIAGFALLLGRAVYLQGLNNDFLQAKGESRYGRVIEIPANRGRILDRNGEALAISTPVKSIWAIPGEVHLSERQLARLAALLELSPREIEKRLADTGRDFVFLKRQIPPELAERVAGLHISGLFQNREYRRYYPSGEVMAHALGFTGVDDIGQEGVELEFQDGLAGKPGSRRVIKDRLGQIVEDVESIKAAQDGHDLALALDVRIQNLAFSHLKAAVAQHRAKAGGVVVLDVDTGELLALANFPTYNPNNRNKLAGAQLLPQHQAAHVSPKFRRNFRRQTFDFHFARHDFKHATLLFHTGRLAKGMHRNFYPHAHIPGHAQQVHMQQVSRDRIHQPIL